MTTKPTNTVPKKMQPIFDEIVAITDAFCAEYLTESYAELARKLAATLSRKRPSPLAVYSGDSNPLFCWVYLGHDLVTVQQVKRFQIMCNYLKVGVPGAI